MEDVELVQSMPRSPCRSSSRTCRRRHGTGGGVGGCTGDHTRWKRKNIWAEEGGGGENDGGGGGGGGDDGGRYVMGDPEKLAK